MNHNYYIRLIEKIRRSLIERNITKACVLIREIPQLALNKKILSPYLPILKRFYQLLTMHELKTILVRRPGDYFTIIQAINNYADGVLPLEQALAIIRTEQFTSCSICLDTLGIVSIGCPAGSCYYLFCPVCLESSLKQNKSCPTCRGRVPSQQTNQPGAQANNFTSFSLPHHAPWQAGYGGFGY